MDATTKSEEGIDCNAARSEAPAGEEAASPGGGWDRRRRADAFERYARTQRLSDDVWRRMLSRLPARTSARARNSSQTRVFVEAVLWVADTGAYWRQLPACYGSQPRRHYVRFIRWANTGLWTGLAACLDDGALRHRLEQLAAAYHESRQAKIVLDGSIFDVED